MDAVEYLKIKKRMLKSNKEGSCNISCNICPFYMQESTTGIRCEGFEVTYPEKAVSIVEKWAAEHPVKTRQSEFLKMFSNARIAIPYNSLTICPQDLDTNFICPESKRCVECKEAYWLTEVPEAEVEE